VNLVIQRIAPDPANPKNTWGTLTVNGKNFSHVVEDELRAPGVKVAKLTAIPPGVYKMRLSLSTRFKKVLPEILNVPMFLGIRMHGGRNAKDSEGCPCLGFGRIADTLTRTIEASEALVHLLKASDDEFHTVDVRNPVGWVPPWTTPSGAAS
jgi:hypothetical protein